MRLWSISICIYQFEVAHLHIHLHCLHSFASVQSSQFALTLLFPTTFMYTHTHTHTSITFFRLHPLQNHIIRTCSHSFPHVSTFLRLLLRTFLCLFFIVLPHWAAAVTSRAASTGRSARAGSAAAALWGPLALRPSSPSSPGRHNGRHAGRAGSTAASSVLPTRRPPKVFFHLWSLRRSPSPPARSAPQDVSYF